MTYDRERARAARDALRDLDNERSLHDNVLFTGVSFPHEQLRTIVLRALDSLQPPEPGDGSDDHALLLRCDVRREPHKNVVASLPLSRRQFYRQRDLALRRLGVAIERELERPHAAVVLLSDSREAREAFINMLRECGQHEAVRREGLSFLGHLHSPDRRAILHGVISEAERYLGNFEAAADHLDQAKALLEHAYDRTRFATLWIATVEIALHVVRADYDAAMALFGSVDGMVTDEQTLHGREATLLEILIGYVASIESSRGAWGRARALLRRAESLSSRGDGRELERGRATRLRLAGRLALQHEGDVPRALAESREALVVAQRMHQLRQAASASVEVGLALAEAGDAEAARHIAVGLEIGAQFSDVENAAVHLADALPVLLHAGQTEVARRHFDALRGGRISPRAAPLIELSEARWALHAADAPTAVERARAARDRLETHGLLPLACDARVVEVESWLALSRPVHARRAFRELTELAQHAGRAPTRRRLRALGTLLAL
jgi:tetratricopeptide (TPR) repeat protein